MDNKPAKTLPAKAVETSINSDLLRFESEVMYNVMLGNVAIQVTNNQGETPVISCLDEEPVSALLARIERAGGAGTVFSLGKRGDLPLVRCVEVIDPQCTQELASTPSQRLH